ncbi:MAG: ABC transporter ATP-binding protein/permease [Gammaproteobacteria bacterium]|nr:ABC transporter ATP-binding protein/permease [Gammaproteobacteria bacterium]
MSNRIQNLRSLIQHLLSYIRWRALLLVILMVAAAITEGLGLLLLVPLMIIVGLAPGQFSGNRIVLAVNDAAGQLGLSLNLSLVVIVFVVLVSLRQIIVYSSSRLIEDTRINYVAKLRKELFEALGATRWGKLSGSQLVQFGQVMLMDCWRVGDAAQSLFRITSGVILLAANVVVAILLSPALALIVLVSISVLTLVFSNRFAAVQVQGTRITRVQNEVYRVVENFVDNLRVAKMAGAESRMQDEFATTVDALSAEYSGFVREAAATRMALQIAGAVGVGVFLLVAMNVFGSSGPELLLLVFISARLIPHIAALNQYAHQLLYSLPAFVHASEALELCRQNPDHGDNQMPLKKPEKAIELRDVTVFAPDDSSKRLIDDVTLKVRIGEVIAIVGPSGAGKSTLADSLAGLLQPHSGSIHLDGIQLDETRLAAWRMQVGYVPQAAVLLRDTVRQNLTFLLRNLPSPEEMDRAMRCAEITDVVKGMAQGLDTRIDRREGVLSGGERQRIALARELLRSPHLLILDEATNALDIDNEARVLGNLRRDYPSMTIVLITHRPTTIADVDRVVFINHGRLSSVTPIEQVIPDQDLPKENIRHA